MPTRGRKPDPAAVRAAKGKSVDLAGVSARSGSRKPPKFLDKLAKAEWARLTKLLAEMSILAFIDEPIIATYCMAYSRCQRALADVAKRGDVIETTNGNLVMNPHLGIARTAQKDMHWFAAEFGLTPSSRTRIHVHPGSAAGGSSPLGSDIRLYPKSKGA